MSGKFMTRMTRAVVVACCCSMWAASVLAQEAPASPPAGDAQPDVGEVADTGAASDASAATTAGADAAEHAAAADADADADNGDAAAAADAASDDNDDNLPWNINTTPEARARAEELFQTGNRRAKDNLTLLAIDSYQAAADLWPNPVILFNLAMVELQAKRLDEAAQHFEQALQYGSKPLSDDNATGEARLEEGRNRLDDIISQLTELEIVCPLPGTKVFLGDRLLTIKDGRFKGRVVIGAFTLVGAREGYENDVRQIVLSPGQSVRYVVIPKQRVTTRRFSPWLPRGVFGLTVAASIVAGVFHWQAKAKFDAYDVAIESRHGMQVGESVIDQDGTLAQQRLDGDRLQTIAGVAYLTAGVSLIAATALYLSNQPRTELRMPRAAEVPVSIAPTVGRDRLGVRATLTF